MSFADNPYQASQPADPQWGQPPSDHAKERLKIPAILLLVLAPIHMLFMLADLIFRIVNAQTGNVMILGDDAAPGAKEGALIGIYAGGAVDVLAILAQIVVALGAWQMLQVKSRQMALLACILSCIPCLSGCCVLGIPLGVWGLIVLNDPQVKQGFPQ
ncbi:MAG: hypothetical protein SFU86_03055 [Pirellulaceae bacterium]|nr:hypothetical protein [Pirellulaceae bacterium]